MSEENTENDKTKEEKDALSRMIELGLAVGINANDEPIEIKLWISKQIFRYRSK